MKAINFVSEFAAQKPLKLAFMSDTHADSPDCDEKALKRDLKIIQDEKRWLFLGGDIFDAIVHTDRKRYTPSRNKDVRDDQINAKLEQVYNLFSPYANNIVFIGVGNHEESILKYTSVDIIDLLVKQLNAIKTNGKIIKGNYQNFIRFDFLNSQGKSYGHYDVLQHHGAGGNAPVTKGALDFNRIIHGSNVDLVVLGHKHNANFLASDPIVYIDDSGTVRVKNRQAIMTPSYMKGRTIEDHNVINFAERFYTHQSLPGFATLDLTPVYENKKPVIKSDITMRIDSVAKIGDLQNVLIKKRVNDIQKGR